MKYFIAKTLNLINTVSKIANKGRITKVASSCDGARDFFLFAGR